MCRVAQAVAARIALIGAINERNAANQTSDALRLGADVHVVYADIFDARANAAVARRLDVQIKRRRRDCIAVPVPTRVLADDNRMIGLADPQQLLFLCPRLARKARYQCGNHRGKDRDMSRTGEGAIRSLSMEKAAHRCDPFRRQN